MDPRSSTNLFIDYKRLGLSIKERPKSQGIVFEVLTKIPKISAQVLSLPNSKPVIRNLEKAMEQENIRRAILKEKTEEQQRIAAFEEEKIQQSEETILALQKDNEARTAETLATQKIVDKYLGENEALRKSVNKKLLEKVNSFPVGKNKSMHPDALTLVKFSNSILNLPQKEQSKGEVQKKAVLFRDLKKLSDVPNLEE